MKSARKTLDVICKYLAYLGCLVIFLVMLMLVLDVLLHLFTTSRVLGNYEITEMGMTLFIFFGIAYTQTQKGHVRVEMFVDMLPKRFKKFVDGIVTLITAVVTAAMTYQAFIQAGTYAKMSTGTAVLKLPYAPFGYIMAIGFLLFTLALLLDAIDSFIHGVRFSKVAEAK